MFHDLFEIAEERDGEKRHPNAEIGRELRSDTAHTLACRPLPLVAFALQNNNVVAARRSKVIGNTGADDTASDNDDIC